MRSNEKHLLNSGPLGFRELFFPSIDIVNNIRKDSMIS